jgi:hypothetical protein
MAGIDKTYIYGNEYAEYRKWWIENYDKMVREMGNAVWMYPFDQFGFDVVRPTPEFLNNNHEDIRWANGRPDIAVWNTSESWDKWLIRNCPIKSYRDRMLEVYPDNWDGFRKLKWVPKKEKKQKFKRRR